MYLCYFHISLFTLFLSLPLILSLCLHIRSSNVHMYFVFHSSINSSFLHTHIQSDSIHFVYDLYVRLSVSVWRYSRPIFGQRQKNVKVHQSIDLVIGNAELIWITHIRNTWARAHVRRVHTQTHTDLLGAIISLHLNVCEGWREIDERINEWKKKRNTLDGERQNKIKKTEKLTQFLGKCGRKVQILWYSISKRQNKKKPSQFGDIALAALNLASSETIRFELCVRDVLGAQCALCFELKIFDSLCSPLRGITPTQCGSSEPQYYWCCFPFFLLVHSLDLMQASSQNSFRNFKHSGS